MFDRRIIILLASKENRFNDFMKFVLRNTALHAFALFVLPQLLGGVVITGGLWSYIIGGFVFSLLAFFVRPIIQIFTLPLNLLTFGVFSFLINALLLYILTVFVSQITIQAFTYPGFSYSGFVIPSLNFNTFTAYIAASVVLSGVVSFLRWLL